MRIIAGKSRGSTLSPIKGTDIRPTLDRVRESVFNIITPHLDEDCLFLDLFAGTGANGLEALSRNIKKSIFVDSSAQSLKIIQKNVEKLGVTAQCTLIRGALPGKLDYLSRNFKDVSIVYADPPFKFNDYDGLLKRIDASRIVKPGGLVLIEHDVRLDIVSEIGNLRRYRQETYGQTQVSFFRNETPENQ